MANILTGIRIICALALIFCPMFSTWFYVFYILGGLSDVFDGIAARHLEKETEFGAQFDTIADLVFAAIVIIKVMQAVTLPVWLIVWIACIALLKCFNILSGFLISGRFVSEHTIMNKLCGILLFAIPLCFGLFPRQPVEVPVILTSAAATVAAIQEGYYIRAKIEVR